MNITSKWKETCEELKDLIVLIEKDSDNISKDKFIKKTGTLINDLIFLRNTLKKLNIEKENCSYIW